MHTNGAAMFRLQMSATKCSQMLVQRTVLQFAQRLLEHIRQSPPQDLKCAHRRTTLVGVDR